MDRKIFKFQFNMSDGRQLTTKKMEEGQALYFLVSVFGSVQTDGLLSLENGVFIIPSQLCDFVILKNEQPYFDEEMFRRAVMMVGEMLNQVNNNQTVVSQIDFGNAH